MDTTHFAPSAGNLQDGMNFTGLNSQTLQAATQPVAVAPSINPQTQHTSPYLQQTNTLVNAPTHPSTAAAYHIQPHGQANNTQTTLPLSSHSQGPTPSSTPPAVPNDQKGPSNFPQYAAMNHIYRQVPQPTPFVVNNPNNNRTHSRGMTSLPSRNQVFILPGQPPATYGPFIPISATASPLNPITAHGSFVTAPQTYPLSQSSNEHHQNMAFYQLPSQNAAGQAPSFNPNYMNRAGHWNTSTTRPQSTVPGIPPMMQNTPLYTNLPTTSIAQPQQQPQQPAPNKRRERLRAVPIIDPITNMEVDVGRTPPLSDATNDEKRKEAEDNRASKKLFQEEVKKLAAEPSSASSDLNNASVSSSSSIYSSSPANNVQTTMTAAATSLSLSNGTAPPTVSAQQQTRVPSPATAASSSDRKKTPSQNSNSSSSSNLNSISSENASVTNSLPKAAQHAAGTHPAKMDFKRPTREDQSLVAAAVAIAPNNGITTASKMNENGKARSETSTTTSPSTQAGGQTKNTTTPKKISKESESTVSALVVGSSESSITVANTSSTVLNTVSQVGLSKVDKVTSNLDVAESIQKAMATKQGMQDGVIVVEDGPTIAKSSAAVISKQVSSESGGSSSLSATTSPSPLAVQTKAKTDLKSQPSSVVRAADKTQVSSKTTLPVDEKPNTKEEKSNSSAKVKSGRGKEANEGVEHSPKNKPAQLTPKHYQESAAKQTTTTAKQTNGESQEVQNVSEGKSKSKNKKRDKKELNKKGQEKEGSDMDVFVGLEVVATVETTATATTKTPKTHESDKVVSAKAQQGVATDTISAANARKTNSSQKPSNDIKENANIVAESIEKTDICPNIPATTPSAPAIRNLEIPDKTEQMPTNDAVSKRRVYSVEFLRQLRYQPHCNLPVQLNSSLPHIFYADSRSRNAPQNGFPITHNFLPTFSNQPHSQSMRGSMVSTRKSQQGMKRDRQGPIHVSLSLRDDVQLRSSKDAWKPARLNPDLKTLSKDDRKTEELYKTVRGILNKITPEKFKTLVDRIKSLEANIDTVPRLQGVIDLMFQKAIDEPGFCRCYAEMCHIIQNISVPNEDPNEKPVTIRAQLLNKCQRQFERNKADELNVVKRQQEIAACTDPDKKKELQLEFEEMERRIRRQSVGNCRFIGELFKLGMLTAKIMSFCINHLVVQIDEESLECLCKLLSTIGQDLESKLEKSSFDVIFNKMRDISEKKSYNVSSRIRFMLQDVIDLRRNHWKPRRETDNPKTIDQLNQEFEKEEMEARLNAMMPRKYDDNNYNRNSRDHKRNNRNDNKMNDDGNWQMVSGKGSYQKTPVQKLDRSKLDLLNNASFSTGEVALGPPSFSSWRSGASTKPNYSSFPSSMPSTKATPMLKTTPSNSVERSKPPLIPQDDNTKKMVRNSASQNAPPVPQGQPTPTASRNTSQTAARAPSPMQLAVLSHHCKIIVDELGSHENVDESVRDFEAFFRSSSQLTQAVGALLSNVVECKPKSMHLCGMMLNKLICQKTITLQHILDGLSNIIECAEDIVIDCPKLWVFLAEILSPLFNEDCLSYSEFETAFVDKFPEQRNGPLLKAVNEIISKSPVIKKSLLLKKLENEDYDNVRKWIDANFENARKSPQFVQTLTEAVCEYFLSDMGDGEEPPKYFTEKIGPLFRFYVENEADLEMNCLVTVYKFAERKEFPRGFLLYIFNALFNSKSISLDAFMAWKKQADDPSRNFHGGAGTMSLKGFYEFLGGQTS